jgi:hypothetical protein
MRNTSSIDDKISELIRRYNKMSQILARTNNKLSRLPNIKSKLKKPKANLNKMLSFSDSNLSYQDSYENTESAPGSAGLINLDGTLNLNMILKGIHSVIIKNNSNKICELALNILTNLINIDIMPCEEIDAKIEEIKTSFDLSQASLSYLSKLEIKYNENFYLATDLVLRYLIK